MIDHAANRDKMATLLTLASHNRKDAEQEERLALANYHAACIAYGIANPHSLAGAKVKCKELRQGSWSGGFRDRTPDREVTVRGTVTLCQTSNSNAYRNHYPKPGEWFVLSASGQTAYSLHDEWEPE